MGVFVTGCIHPPRMQPNRAPLRTSVVGGFDQGIEIGLEHGAQRVSGLASPEASRLRLRFSGRHRLC
jgi:hypothetical protein